MSRIKRACVKCKKMIRIRYNHLCWFCYGRKFHKMPNAQTLEEALAVTRVVRRNGRNHFINVPQILLGHKVKIVLADDGN